MAKRVYSKGVFDFEDIVTSGAVISDKTELIYNMVHDNKFVFLSRPRRFGKSLLCSQLKFYFQGRKDLFANFKIAELEKEWLEYPVLSFSMSSFKELSPDGVKRGIYQQLEDYVDTYDKERSPGAVFRSLIRRAYEQTGRGVVVIIDEYDAPLLAAKPEDLQTVRRILLDFYQQIKDSSSYIRFAFLTGITRFSNLSIFSALNNLVNISMNRDYATICGITQSELETVFKPDVEILASELGKTYEQTMAMLKERYDGYHFCKRQKEDIYNPFSLTLAFADREINSYWYASGTPTFLVERLKKDRTNLANLNEAIVSISQMESSIDSLNSVYPLLYQSGYLTIKGYDPVTDLYKLGFPNSEVRQGLMESVLNDRLTENADSRGTAGMIYGCLLNHDVDGAMQHFKAFFSRIPYPNQANPHLVDFANFEAYYQSMLFAIFNLFSPNVHAESTHVLGRSDVVFYLADTTYVLEIKLARIDDDPAKLLADAFAQMQAKNYAGPYATPGTRVVLIATVFSHHTRTIEQWETREL